MVGYKCEHCGRSKEQGWRMEGSHIYPEGVYKSISADVDNILCLCSACHNLPSENRPTWHNDPIYFGDWFRNKYPERYEVLKERARKSQQADLWFWEQKWKELNGKATDDTTE